MSFGFQTAYTGRTQDGKNWVCAEPLMYLAKSGAMYRVKVGTTTDGPSVPSWLPNALDWGPVWLPGALHDACYRDGLERLGDGQGWFPFRRGIDYDKDWSDSLFREAMEAQGVNEAQRELFYRAVVLFGEKAWKDDQAT